MTDFTNRVALVTGSARGIGKAIALRYASLGAGVGAVAIQADVSRVNGVERLFSQTFDRFGALDIVVANAQLKGVQPEASR